jgi:hypothetical protein
MYKFKAITNLNANYETIETDFSGNSLLYKFLSVIIDADDEQPDYKLLIENISKSMIDENNNIINIININSINYKKFTNIDVDNYLSYHSSNNQNVVDHKKTISIMTDCAEFNLSHDLLYIVNDFKHNHIIIDVSDSYDKNKLIIDTYDELKGVYCINFDHTKNEYTKWIDLLSNIKIKQLLFIHINYFRAINDVMNNRLTQPLKFLQISIDKPINQFDQEFVELCANCTKTLHISAKFSDSIIKQEYIKAFSQYDNNIEWTIIDYGILNA